MRISFQHSRTRSTAVAVHSLRAGKGVRFVEVILGNREPHGNHSVKALRNCETLDEGLAALLGDLKQRGLFDKYFMALSLFPPKARPDARSGL